MIAIGNVLRGPELRFSSIDKAIMAVMNAIVELRGEFELGQGPAVNVVFYVPGSLGGFDWEGSRSSTFFRKDQLQMVQVAIPKEVADSENPMDFVIAALHDANVIAFECFRKRKIEYPFDEAESLVEEVHKKMSGTAWLFFEQENTSWKE